jgi:Flp pilus assembly protein TadD
VNNYKWFRGFDEFDGWQNSGISGAAVRSFYYPPKPSRCQDCHMPEVPSDDAGNDNGYVNSHRFVGSNTALSAFHGYSDQLRATVEFLQDGQLTVDAFALEIDRPGEDPILVAPIDRHAVQVRPGQRISADIVVRTRGVGHQFTGGTTDSNMSWIEVSLLDEEGNPVLLSGGMGEDQFVDPAAHSYRGIFLDEAGQRISKRNGWDRRTPVYVHAIPPGAGDTVHYELVVPEDASGTLTLRARLNYRKHKQEYHRWVFGATESAEQPDGAVSTPAVDTRAWDYDDSLVPDLPVVVMASTEVTLQVGDTALVDAEVPDVDRVVPASEDWMRFNDWGIGLLRQTDLRGALRAFRWVQEANPEYADAWVNEARVHLQEGNLDAAETALNHALELQPGYRKAEYFLAQAARGYGEYDRAIGLLEEVAADYPYDRVVRIDLGNVYYLTGRYEQAVDHLLAVLDTIDPEELGAHYNLMLSYRAMGEDAKAEIHEARYLRYKDDEDIRRLTGPYKRANPLDNNEAQPIHTHRMEAPGSRFTAPERFPWTDWLEGGAQFRGRRTYPGPTPPWERADRPGGAVVTER